MCDLQSGGGAAPNFLEAHLYQSFNVEIFTKVRTKVDIHLGISGDKVFVQCSHRYLEKSLSLNIYHLCWYK